MSKVEEPQPAEPSQDKPVISEAGKVDEAGTSSESQEEESAANEPDAPVSDFCGEL